MYNARAATTSMHVSAHVHNYARTNHVAEVLSQSSISCARAFSLTTGERRASKMVAQVKGGSAFLCHRLNTSE